METSQIHENLEEKKEQKDNLGKSVVKAVFFEPLTNNNENETSGSC